MFVTRCVECNHEELTVNQECSCGCHTPAPQPQPNNPPSRYKGRCDVHGLHVCDECQYGETDAKLLAVAEARIAALEAQLADAQERLEMAVEASQALLSRLRSLHENEEYRGVWMIAQLHRGPYRGPKYEKEMIYLDAALAATAASVAQHTASVERRGAAKELKAITAEQQMVLDQDGELCYMVPSHRLLARVAELEGE